MLKKLKTHARTPNAPPCKVGEIRCDLHLILARINQTGRMSSPTASPALSGLTTNIRCQNTFTTLT